MISFKSFVTAVHEAIVNASDTLMDKNISILDKYFTEVQKSDKDASGGLITKTTLVPKTVILEYPQLNAAGEIENLEISAPLITLVPLTMSQIDTVTLTADFQITLVDDDVQISFEKKTDSGGLFQKKASNKTARLEIKLTPQESSEGLKMLIEGYEAILKRQLS